MLKHNRRSKLFIVLIAASITSFTSTLTMASPGCGSLKVTNSTPYLVLCRWPYNIPPGVQVIKSQSTSRAFIHPNTTKSIKFCVHPEVKDLMYMPSIQYRCIIAEDHTTFTYFDVGFEYKVQAQSWENLKSDPAIKNDLKGLSLNYKWNAQTGVTVTISK